jgi:hypothetical protein
MSRIEKNRQTREQMCTRLTQLLDVVYRESDADIARRLGYSNASTLYRVRRNEVFPDVERLERLVAARPAPGVVINLNWIVAGVGQPLLRISRGVVAGEMSMGNFIDTYVSKVR